MTDRRGLSPRDVKVILDPLPPDEFKRAFLDYACDQENRIQRAIVERQKRITTALAAETSRPVPSSASRTKR